MLDGRYIPRQEQHLCSQIQEGNKENGFQFHIHEFLVISNCHAAPHNPFVRVLPEPSGVSVSHYPTFYWVDAGEFNRGKQIGQICIRNTKCTPSNNNNSCSLFQNWPVRHLCVSHSRASTEIKKPISRCTQMVPVSQDPFPG